MKVLKYSKNKPKELIQTEEVFYKGVKKGPLAFGIKKESFFKRIWNSIIKAWNRIKSI